VIQASGHTLAQAEQPTHDSGFAMNEKLYPFEFASLFSNNTFEGQATTHKLQPLHLSTFTTIAPFTFAILFCLNCRTNVTKKHLIELSQNV